MKSQIDQLLDQGTAVQARGDLKGAEDLYRRALGVDANHADALQLLAGLKYTQGDLDAAQDYLEKAVAQAPRVVMLRINLAAVHIKKGNPERALPEARAAVAAEPQNPVALKQLAGCAERLGLSLEAADAFERLAPLRAATVDTELRCARLFLAAGDAQRSFQAALRAARLGTDADLDGVHKALSAAALAKRDWPELISIAQSWTKQRPKLIEAHEMLSRAYLQAGDTFRAQKAYQTVFNLTEEIEPEHALNYGSLCLITQDFDEAGKYLTMASEAMPDSSRAAHGMARLHTFRGNLEAAEEASKKAIALDPNEINPYVQLTTLRRGDIDADKRERMEVFWQKSEEPVELLSLLGFALGDIAHKEKRYDDAFRFYADANRMSFELYTIENKNYDLRAWEKKAGRLIDLFGNNSSWTPENSDPGPEPIFIVGMPRSGTTLAESILAAHSKVFGGGEVLAGSKLLDDFLRQADSAPNQSLDDLFKAHGKTWIETYIRSLSNWGDAVYMTDKLPINFLGVGLLAHLFPRSRFIHMRRDSLDTAFSIFRHSFPRAYDFSHDLEATGHFYGLYLKIMAFYEERFADRLTTIQYETVAEDPDTLLPQMVAAAGLEWEPQCAEFHKNKRTIATFSSVQVRSPISGSSLGVSEPYHKLMQPFSDALARVSA